MQNTSLADAGKCKLLTLQTIDCRIALNSTPPNCTAHNKLCTLYLTALHTIHCALCPAQHKFFTVEHTALFGQTVQHSAVFGQAVGFLADSTICSLGGATVQLTLAMASYTYNLHKQNLPTETFGTIIYFNV